MIRKLILRRARDDARDLLREMILRREVGGRIEEVELSSRMGVSRTPVREALIALEQEGLVRSAPHKGFVLVSADAALVRESFPIIGALEAAALLQSGESLLPSLALLRKTNAALKAARRKAEQYEHDHALHALLTAPCGNARLLSLLEAERTRARFFDGSHRRGMADLDGSCAAHERIIDAVERRDFKRAAVLLGDHWDRGVDVVVTWLEQKR
jgi:DNA-binding GntR family transcriptional regulator